MKARAPHSLTARITLVFALISCLIVSGLGLYLYSSAKQALETRADYTLVGRVERFRHLLHDLYTVRQMEERPALFENMLGNESDVRIFQRLGEKPFILVNPDHMPIPAMTPVPIGRELGISALHPGVRADGVRVRWISALAEIGDHGDRVRITAAYVMTQESRMLADYRARVFGAATLAVLLSTLMSFMLLRRGLKPLHAMSRQAARITPAHLAARLPDQDAPAELRQFAKACNAMLDRLQAGYEHLSQFSADLAHEMRTPVNILMGQTQVALGQPRSGAEYEHVLESNLEELTRLAHIIENILFLSRADHDAAEVTREPLALLPELRKIADYFEGPAQERGMDFEVIASGTCHANAIMWQRAVSNLVVNAIRYGRPGTRISLGGRADASGSQVTVDNRGQAFSPDEIDRMFRRFYRGDQSRSQHTESNGLGLAIVVAIMAIHGGSADAQGADDGRICFRLRFPPPEPGDAGQGKRID
ncbi:heavy metal sensor histidine kinase [Castellaniella sp.]|uniref:heavy metal sensor histidine kinase n=1 Tax=Castellaniella sp. TaxID=1955812 RepID=UPI003C7389A8